MKIMFRFCLIIAAMLSFYSCVHDEIYLSSDPASKEYHSKSLWREDERYIRNVMQVYFENESKIKKIAGEPFWDYATTVGNFDESYLMVPVLDNNKVVSVLQVPRQRENIYFYYTNHREHIEFFQQMVFAKYKKALYPEGSGAGKLMTCIRQWYTVWVPDSESNPDPDSGPGHWDSYSVIRCQQGPLEPDYCIGIVGPNGECDGGGDNNPYPYPGGGGNPQSNQNPCEKLKAQNNAAFKNKVDDLKSKLTLKKETGYTENNTGTFTYKDNATATENSNQLKLPDPDYYKDIKGYMHTHPNNFEDSEGRMRIGFKIFSPADVMYFSELVRNAKENGLPLDNVYAVMVSGTGTYQIRFTGNANQIKTTYTNTGDEYNEMYIKYFLANSKNSDELNFLKFMDEQMYVKGVSLIKMNDNGTFTTKTVNTDKTGVEDSDCPQ